MEVNIFKISNLTTFTRTDFSFCQAAMIILLNPPGGLFLINGGPRLEPAYVFFFYFKTKTVVMPQILEKSDLTRRMDPTQHRRKGTLLKRKKILFQESAQRARLTTTTTREKKHIYILSFNKIIPDVCENKFKTF